jgi:hypothetical protein
MKARAALPEDTTWLLYTAGKSVYLESTDTGYNRGCIVAEFHGPEALRNAELMRQALIGQS